MKNYMSREINYTIIIPHKNMPELLQRCLDSIPQRDDIQIIVVDDNSDPDIVNFEIFPGVAKSYTEVIFTKEGKGAGYARNVGLKKAVGKWILFADADDFFADGFLEHVDKYHKSAYDLVYFGVYRISKETEKKSNIDPYYEKLMKGAIYEQKHEEYKYGAYVPWGKIIKLSLIKENNIIFDETIVANDKIFSIKAAHNATNIHFDERKIYTYMPANSILTPIKTPKANFDRFCVYVRMNRFFEDISQEKYKINLILPLKNLIDAKNMKYFYKGVRLFRESNFSFFSELFRFCWIFPQKILGKLIR